MWDLPTPTDVLTKARTKDKDIYVKRTLTKISMMLRDRRAQTYYTIVVKNHLINSLVRKEVEQEVNAVLAEYGWEGLWKVYNHGTTIAVVVSPASIETD